MMTDELPEVDKIRFAVGTEDGPRSSWWFVKAEDTGDVYASAQRLGGLLKLSIHRIDEDRNLDRYCQFGFYPKQLRRLRQEGLPEPSPKYMFRWQRPISPARGARHVASIVIPSDFLNRSPPPMPTSSIRRKFRTLFHPAPTGHASEFMLWYSMQPAEDLEDKFLRLGKPMFYHQFANGECFHFVAREIPFDSDAVRRFEWNKGRHLPLSRAMDDLKPGEKLPGLTAIVPNEPDEDGFIKLVEISNLTFTKT